MNTNINFDLNANLYDFFDFYVEEYDDELESVMATFQGEIVAEWLQAKGYTPEIYLSDEAGEADRNILFNYIYNIYGGFNMNNNLNINTNASYGTKLVPTKEEKKEVYFINYERLENHKTRSKWDKGVKDYAFELLENIEDNLDGFESIDELREALLGGASSWHDYSWGGCSFIYNKDICEKLATPSEQKRKRNGELKPNSSEEWLDVQARALFQAFLLIKRYTEKVRI